MKKLINAPETVLGESLDGFAAAHADIVVLGEGRQFVRRKVLKPGKVGIVSGGGSGHEPLHALTACSMRRVPARCSRRRRLTR